MPYGATHEAKMAQKKYMPVMDRPMIAESGIRIRKSPHGYLRAQAKLREDMERLQATHSHGKGADLT
jgi:acyl-coenzyme A thioesterase PaaI-like protein